jgi:hypothetical protein
MTDIPEIAEVKFAGASAEDVARGLLGWVSCTLSGSLQLDGIAVRRTRGGKIALSFPARKDARGVQHPFLRPLTDVVRHEIEAQVFCALGIDSNRNLPPTEEGV